MISRFNIWYDELPGTPRFLLFMIMMSAAILPFHLGFAYGSMALSLFGLAMLQLMVAIAIGRAFGMGGGHRYIAYAMLFGAAVIIVAAISALLR